MNRRGQKNWRYFFIFGFYHMRPLFSREHWWLDSEWKIWTFSFQGYAKIFCSWSGLVTALCQSQVGFGAFQKMAWFASARNLVFALFFSKCCHLEHNEDNNLKPSPNVTHFPKFSGKKKALSYWSLKSGLKWYFKITILAKRVLQFFRTLRFNQGICSIPENTILTVLL